MFLVKIESILHVVFEMLALPCETGLIMFYFLFGFLFTQIRPNKTIRNEEISVDITYIYRNLSHFELRFVNGSYHDAFNRTEHGERILPVTM